MVALTRSHSPSSLAELQNAFLLLLPKIQTHAQISFRHLPCADQRTDRMAEAVALAWKWFVRLHELGKDVNQFPMVFVYLVVKSVRCGRRLAGKEKAQEALSWVAHQRHGFRVTSISEATGSRAEMAPEQQVGMRRMVQEALQNNTHTPIPEQVVFRLDWPRFFLSLPHRDRRMIEFLSVGNRPQHAALQFGVSRARVSQLRQKWRRQWRVFQGEEILPR